MRSRSGMSSASPIAIKQSWTGATATALDKAQVPLRHASVQRPDQAGFYHGCRASPVEPPQRRQPDAVKADVAALRSVSPLPDHWLLTGLVYDVATGRAETGSPLLQFGRTLPKSDRGRRSA